MLCVWPLLPIVIRARGHEMWGVDNIIAALQHSDRICQLELIAISSSHMENVLAAMQQPFLELTRLELRSRDETMPVPPSFLGGSSPSLQTLTLGCIQFQGLPKLLSSATYLVRLYLYSIPHSGYISPEAMASCLPVLTRLETLVIRFESPKSRPDRDSRRLPSRTRTLLPVLTMFHFKGVSEYLEDLVAKMDAPLLEKLTITFFNQLIFDTPQITQFICRTPNFNSRDEARVAFSSSHVWITFPQTSNGELELSISCSPSDWQLSTLAQVCTSSFPQALIPAVERLYILEHRSPGLRWQDDIETNQWLQLLHSFTSLKDLYISQEFVPRIVPALRDLVEKGAIEVLLAPQSLFLEEQHASGPVQKTIQQFVVARQLGGHPVAVSRWEDPWTLPLDGYIAHMFTPKDAEMYLVDLLKRAHSSRIQWRTDVTGAVLAAPPAGLMSDEHDWVIDYAVRDTGPVIQQKIWTPKKMSDKARWVDHEQRNCPIFFIHSNGQDLGLPLIEAAGGNCMCLRGAEEAAPVGRNFHIQIRINVSLISTFILHNLDLIGRICLSQWRGYEHLDWNEQISIKKQTLDRKTVSIKTFAKVVGRKVLKFMEVILILLRKHSSGN